MRGHIAKSAPGSGESQKSSFLVPWEDTETNQGRLTQRVQVSERYIHRLQSRDTSFRPRYIPYSCMHPLGEVSFEVYDLASRYVDLKLKWPLQLYGMTGAKRGSYIPCLGSICMYYNGPWTLWENSVK